ncbi:MAG: hypothetical protein ACFFEU_12725 [Candidatus Thorarchaeota archaeon]
MPEPPSMAEIQRRAFFSTLKDGTVELFQGLLLFIAGIGFFNIYSAFLGLFLIILLRLQWPRISRKIKEQFIYPRLGYVELRSDHEARLRRYHILLGASISISVVLFFVLVYLNGWNIATTLTYTPIIIGGALFGRSLYFCIFSGKWNYLILGLVSILMVAVFIILPFPMPQDHTILYAWSQAILMTLTGIWKFRRFQQDDSIVEEL